MTSITDVYLEAIQRLRDNTPIEWKDFFVPDDEDAPDIYGTVQVLGPYEGGRRERGIISAADDPMGGALKVAIVARTVDAMLYEAARATRLLRGWKPTNTSELTARPARGYEPVSSKNPPTLFVHNILFEFTTNYDGDQ